MDKTLLKKLLTKLSFHKHIIDGFENPESSSYKFISRFSLRFILENLTPENRTSFLALLENTNEIPETLNPKIIDFLYQNIPHFEENYMLELNKTLDSLI